MRLDKFISDTTYLSRNDAKKAIKAARVQINGELARNANHKVTPKDTIKLDGETLTLLKDRYFMLNKPAGYICATEDADHPTVLELLQEPQRHKLHIAGRLDKDTTGLVLITDNGQWTHRVISPNKSCPKRYRVSLASPISEKAIQQLQDGIILNNERKKTKPAIVETIDAQTIYLTIAEGKYHQVKRMLAAVGNRVTALHRDQIGPLKLPHNLALGDYRPLTDLEINYF